MAGVERPASAPSPDGDRLSCWKEIAAHVGRSVRTALRWEKELGLPVHRVHGKRGEIVYALRSEIDEWLRTSGPLPAADPPDQAEAPVSAPGPAGGAGTATEQPQSAAAAQPAKGEGVRRLVPVALGFGAGLVLLAIWWGWPSLVRSRPTSTVKPGALSPADWRLDGRHLTTLDIRGQVVFEWTFDFDLRLEAYDRQRPELFPNPVIFDDLDGDGRNETLFLSRSFTQENDRLWCFDADGKARFSYQPRRSVRFGAQQYDPPFPVTRMLTAHDAAGRKNIWLVSQHNLDFPAVVEKLSTQGESEAEYWNNGHVTLMTDRWLGDRHLVFVGGTNNEHWGAALAVLDYEAPSGSAPATKSEYRCEGGCSTDAPAEFFVFPQTALSRVLDVRPYVREVRTPLNGEILVTVEHGNTVRGTAPGEFTASVYYTFDKSWSLVSVEAGDQFRATHAALVLRGRLRSPFGPAAEVQLLPVLSWDRQSFVAIRPVAKGP